jgi:hypothetical protein
LLAIWTVAGASLEFVEVQCAEQGASCNAIAAALIGSISRTAKWLRLSRDDAARRKALENQAACGSESRAGMPMADRVSATIVIGTDPNGAPVEIDVGELLATRLLVQGNSGSGKSHLLRRLLEESAPLVQQVVIDPEGDFVTLAEEFGHVVIDAAAYAENEIGRLASRIRKHRASVVLALDELETSR